MPIDSGGFNPRQAEEDAMRGAVEERQKRILNSRDQERNRANDFEKKAGELQGAKYEAALLMLMRRTGDNAELLSAMNGFLEAIQHAAYKDDSEEALGKGSVQGMIRFFTEAQDQLRYTVYGKSKNPGLKPWIV